MTQIEPLGDRVLCKRLMAPEVTEGGIALPESSRVHLELADVLHVSAEVTRVKVGERVLIGRYTGTNVLVNREAFTLVRVDDIIGRIRET